jgi:hypothetical protein
MRVRNCLAPATRAIPGVTMALARFVCVATGKSSSAGELRFADEQSYRAGARAIFAAAA